MGEDDRLPNVMPLFHIHGLVAGLLAPLCAGSSIVCTPGFTIPDVLEWLTRFPATWYAAIPTIHQAIWAALSSNPLSIDGHRLRFIRSSSASLPPRVIVISHDDHYYDVADRIVKLDSGQIEFDRPMLQCAFEPIVRRINGTSQEMEVPPLIPRLLWANTVQPSSIFAH